MLLGENTPKWIEVTLIQATGWFAHSSSVDTQWQEGEGMNNSNFYSIKEISPQWLNNTLFVFQFPIPAMQSNTVFRNTALSQKRGNIMGMFSYLLDGHVLPTLETPWRQVSVPEKQKMNML